MPTTIAKNSKETVERLIDDAFHKHPDAVWYDQERENLIKTAENFGLTEKANELKKLI